MRPPRAHYTAACRRLTASASHSLAEPIGNQRPDLLAGATARDDSAVVVVFREPVGLAADHELLVPASDHVEEPAAAADRCDEVIAGARETEERDVEVTKL